MSTTKQVSVDATAPNLHSLERAKQLASALLSERGEASGAVLSRELHDVVRKLGADDRHGFQHFLAAEFQPDATALRAAAEKYLAGTTAEAAADLAQAADPPRQELLRRMNMAQGGTAALVAMRKEILARLQSAGPEAARCRSQASVRLLVQSRLSRSAPHRLAVARRGAGKADRL